MILGVERQGDADYLDSCRNKRNTAEYDSVGHVSPEEARELVDFSIELRTTVRKWLKATPPGLIQP